MVACPLVCQARLFIVSDQFSHMNVCTRTLLNNQAELSVYLHNSLSQQPSHLCALSHELQLQLPPWICSTVFSTQGDFCTLHQLPFSPLTPESFPEKKTVAVRRLFSSGFHLQGNPVLLCLISYVLSLLLHIFGPFVALVSDRRINLVPLTLSGLEAEIPEHHFYIVILDMFMCHQTMSVKLSLKFMFCIQIKVGTIIHLTSAV